MCPHPNQFGDVHETVFKDGLGNDAGPVGYQIKQTELRLHIGGKTGMRGGTHRNRLWPLTVHIQAYPIVADGDIRARFAQLGQYGIQCIGASGMTHHATAGDSRRHQKCAGLDAIGQHAINTAAEPFDPFDGNFIGTGAANLRAKSNEEVAVSTISGSRAAFSMMVVPVASVAALIIVIVAPTLTLSMTICAPRKRPSTDALT